MREYCHSSLIHIMQSLSKHGLNHPSFADSFSNCACPIHASLGNFESSLKSLSEDFAHITLFPREEHTSLRVNGKVPKMRNPKCVIAICLKCGVDKIHAERYSACTGWDAIAKVVL